jgi:AcrR family transcriptional regulator
MAAVAGKKSAGTRVSAKKNKRAARGGKKFASALSVSGAPAGTKDETRRRILAAAGEVFSERGFDGATIREIVRRAHVNLAAVNYHFSDKEELYVSLFCPGPFAEEMKQKVAEAGKSPRARLEAFIAAFLFHLLGEGRPNWVGKLMAREMVEPTRALDKVVEDMIRPIFSALREILSELMDAAEDSRTVRDVGASVVGQCLFYKHSEAVIRRLYPEIQYDERTIAGIAGHVMLFSEKAIAGILEQSGRDLK